MVDRSRLVSSHERKVLRQRARRMRHEPSRGEWVLWQDTLEIGLDDAGTGRMAVLNRRVHLGDRRLLFLNSSLVAERGLDMYKDAFDPGKWESYKVAATRNRTNQVCREECCPSKPGK